jgi:leucyl/phenylalanyl-tRNA---protein transferase
MPVYRLPEAIAFPPADRAAKSGLLAVGGDLSSERLLAAYRAGIFPWYGDGDPILWWSPDPRFVLFPDDLHVSRSMRQFLKIGIIRITFDQSFRKVIAACQRFRPDQNGTWITGEMREAYADLHDLGYAHSVEVWQGEELVGGLYGLSLGRAFFGESMFSAIPNASKAALITLVPRLRGQGFDLIDCQVETAHLAGLGARPIPRRDFCAILKESLRYETLRGNWGKQLALSPENSASCVMNITRER